MPSIFTVDQVFTLLAATRGPAETDGTKVVNWAVQTRIDMLSIRSIMAGEAVPYLVDGEVRIRKESGAKWDENGPILDHVVAATKGDSEAKLAVRAWAARVLLDDAEVTNLLTGHSLATVSEDGAIATCTAAGIILHMTPGIMPTGTSVLCLSDSEVPAPDDPRWKPYPTKYE